MLFCAFWLLSPAIATSVQEDSGFSIYGTHGAAFANARQTLFTAPWVLRRLILPPKLGTGLGFAVRSRRGMADVSACHTLGFKYQDVRGVLASRTSPPEAKQHKRLFQTQRLQVPLHYVQHMSPPPYSKASKEQTHVRYERIDEPWKSGRETTHCRPRFGSEI